jgi:hypothetical protein
VIVCGQVASSSTAATALCTIPPGPVHVVIANVGPATASVGPGTVLPNDGLLVGPGAAPTYFTTFVGSKGVTLTFCPTSNGSTATVSYLISTDA